MHINTEDVEKSKEKEKDSGTEAERPNPILATNALIGEEEQNENRKNKTQLPWTAGIMQ